MYQKQRLDDLMSIISAKKVISTKDLAKKVFTSKSTLRRDLIELEREKKINRSFGEVRLVKGQTTEFGFDVRMDNQIEKKKYIADLASDFIGNSQSIFVDSSTTCMYLAPYLKKASNAAVITNGIYLAASLADATNLNLFVCGGHVKNMAGSVVGEAALSYVNHFRPDIIFLSCEGIDANGIYMANEEQANVKRKMIRDAEEAILLVDSSKVNKKCYIRLCDLKAISDIITDKEFPPDIQKQLDHFEIEVLC